VCCVLFERGVLFCVMCVICVLCLIVLPLPPSKNLIAVQINNNYQGLCLVNLMRRVSTYPNQTDKIIREFGPKEQKKNLKNLRPNRTLVVPRTLSTIRA
jgi:hypothetical protein